MADLEIDKPALDLAVNFSHRGVLAWYFVIATVCLFAPDQWFGPTWWQFQTIPHGGHGLGIASLLLGMMTLYAVWRRKRRLLMTALGMGGVAFYVGAWLIILQGITGGTGLMESPFMMYVGCDLLIKSALLRRVKL